MEQFIEYCNKNGLDLNENDLSKKLDELDELSSFKNEFYIPKKKNFIKDFNGSETEEMIYLTGNSLGLQSKSLESEMKVYLDQWRVHAVEGHHNGKHPFLHGDEELQLALSKVVGAQEKEVCPMNSLSVNLHLMLMNFYRPTSDRFKIIIEEGAFPSDLYVAESQIRNHGYDPSTALIKIRSENGEGTTISMDRIRETLNEHSNSVALIMLSGIQYYTGQLFNIKEITALGHSFGAVVGWDLAHAAGNVELSLHDWNVDFACWCTYKYMNCGPGCIGCVFVHSNHTNTFTLKSDKRLAGWFGNKLSHRFHKEKEFVAEEGALGFRCSNPSIADLTSLRNSLNIINRATIQKLVKKQVILTGFLEYLLVSNIDKSKISIITPSDFTQRGSQLSLTIKNIKASELKSQLLSNGVICDVREPDVIRVSPVPLYNSFTDVANFISILLNLIK